MASLEMVWSGRKYLEGVVLAVLGVEAGVDLREGAGAQQVAHLEAERGKMQHTTQIILLLALIRSIPLTTIPPLPAPYLSSPDAILEW